ncbi:MAG: hypothetical protein J6U20_05020 [Fibrobacter sp.]|nr:hypothetical protein [Fibrobacter sp.]
MRFLALAFLLLVSLAAAESQEDIYYRALKAEEAGDIPLALKTFEEALETPGPYTAEIQEIVDSYREAMGKSAAEPLNDSTVSPWEFHSYGNVGYRNLYYDRDDSTNESGKELSTSMTFSLDYDSKDILHSFELNLSGDWFIDKEDMPSLDTSAWEASFGLEYSLVGNSFVFDIGSNMNVTEEDDLTPDFFLWIEKYFARFDKHKFGVALSGYENLDGPLSTAAYVSWRRYAKYGWKSSVYAGARFEADSISSSEFWLKWIGPSLKPSISYRFQTEISIDLKTNLFYGFVVDGPDAEYEKVKKLSISWGTSISWKPTYVGILLGVDQFYRSYDAPADYVIDYPEKSTYTEIKASLIWDI